MGLNVKRTLKIVGAILLLIGIGMQVNETNFQIAAASFLLGMIVMNLGAKARKSDDN